MALSDDLSRIAQAAAGFAHDGESVVGILPAEPASGRRVYLCSYESGAGGRSWLALDDTGSALRERSSVREAVSIAALCELAVETAGGGDLEELRAQLVALRLTENPPGIEEAEQAALELEAAIGAPPRLATPAYLDAIGTATMHLERTLGETGGSPFAQAMREATATVEALTAEIEREYKAELQ